VLTNALVTGAAGFIGFHLCDRLLRDGVRVVALDDLSPYYDVALKDARRHLLKERHGLEVEIVDVADKAGLQAAWRRARPEQVFHLAAQAGVRYSLENPGAYVSSNLFGFANVLECCRELPPQHLLYASSSSVYGANPIPWSEHQPADHPVSFYAATKKANEVMAHSYAALFGFPATGLRFFTVYGEWGRPDMAFFKFADAIMRGTAVELYNEGRSTRDFTYVRDAVEAVVRIARRPPSAATGPSGLIDPAQSPVAPHRVINIASGTRTTLTEFVDAIAAALGRHPEIRLRDMMPGDVADTWADVTLLGALAGYVPDTPLREGIGEFARWYKQTYAS
jgi:UDP-glucuronate 4-epimerase